MIVKYLHPARACAWSLLSILPLHLNADTRPHTYNLHSIKNINISILWPIGATAFFTSISSPHPRCQHVSRPWWLQLVRDDPQPAAAIRALVQERLHTDLRGRQRGRLPAHNCRNRQGNGSQRHHHLLLDILSRPGRSSDYYARHRHPPAALLLRFSRLLSFEGPLQDQRCTPRRLRVAPMSPVTRHAISRCA